MTAPRVTLAGRPSFLASGAALLRLSWARTMSPLLLTSMLALVALPMLFALVWASEASGWATRNPDPAAFLAQRYDQLVFAIATPLIALLLGTSAFSAEAEDGTLLYLVTTTTPRWWIGLWRVVFAAGLTALLSVVSVLGAGLIATGTTDPMGVSRAFAIAAAFGGATYAALFTGLAVLARRALVTGLGYVLFWEGILSSTFPALHYLSVRQWMLAIAASLTETSDGQVASGPSVTASVVGGIAVVVLSVGLAGRQLNRPRISRVGT